MVRPTPVFQEIKQQLIESNETQRVTRDEIIRLREAFKSSISDSKMTNLRGLEKSREKGRGMFGTMADIGKGAVGAIGTSAGGIMGLLTSLIGSVPIIAMAAVVGAISLAITTFLNLDFEEFKKNILTLLSLKDDLGGYLETFGKTGAFVVIMGGIGLGLAAVGLGSAIGAGGGKLAEWMEPGWTKVVKENVRELLTIARLIDNDTVATMKEGGTFFVVMTGIGVGLAAFGIGSAVGGIGEAFAKWSGGDDWAKKIRANVKELLGIVDDVAGNLTGYERITKGGEESSAFALIMAGIGAGLVAFGVGAFVGGGAEGFADWAGGNDWAKKIRQNVGELLGIIDDISGKEATYEKMFRDAQIEGGTFATIMSGIGAGLAAFGSGAFVSGAALGFTQWSAGDDWAEKIRDNAAYLISIPDTLVSDGESAVVKAGQFMIIMERLGTGLSVFAGKQFGAALKQAGADVVNFLRGDESPIAAIIGLGDNIDKLDKTATALEKIGNALQKLALFNFAGGGSGIYDMTRDLMNVLPVLEVLVNGGTIPGTEGILWGAGTKVKGLASPEIQFDEAVANVNKIRAITGMQLVQAEQNNATAALDATNLSNAQMGRGFNNIDASTTVNAPSSTSVAIPLTSSQQWDYYEQWLANNRRKRGQY